MHLRTLYRYTSKLLIFWGAFSLKKVDIPSGRNKSDEHIKLELQGSWVLFSFQAVYFHCSICPILLSYYTCMIHDIV